MKKFNYVLAVLALLMLSCEKDAVDTKKTNNPEFEVSLLFENDGCMVYRFWDYGRSHYYVKCKSSSETISTVHSDKTTFPEEIVTSQGK